MRNTKLVDENKGKDINSIASILPVGDNLPEEFKRFDYILYLPHYIPTFFFWGVVSHLSFIYYAYLVLRFGGPYFWPVFPMMVYAYIGGLGITVGAHRYWTHKSFKANKKLQVLLMCMQTVAGQYPIFKWCRDHRVHHKYTDTNADPHSAARGFWFSHMTWYFQKRHPDVEEKFKTIHISDLANDPIVRFQSRHYWKLIIVFFFAIPTIIMKLLYPYMSVFELLCLRFASWGSSNHFASMVNSVSHIWGTKPYDKSISPTENAFVSFLSVGEGWHNFHHAFPWDFRAAEFGLKSFNLSNFFILFFASIGWAWDLKTVSNKLLVERINRTGSSDHPLHKEYNETGGTEEIISTISATTIPSIWGWGDESLTKDDIDVTETIFSSSSSKDY